MKNLLSANELNRYQKHLMLSEIGEEGQEKLKHASVLVVGTGGLGSPVSMYLAAAGIGRIGIVDSDRVELSNLPRQILYSTKSIGERKAEFGAKRLEELNPEVHIEVHDEYLDENNARGILTDYSVVVDCTDNLETRFLINSTCVTQVKPFVHGAVYQFEGQVSVFDATQGPCYQCLYPVIPDKNQYPSPSENGLLNTLPGIIGTIQASETIKMILKIGNPLVGRLLIIDALEMKFREVRLKKNPTCTVCKSNFA
jgi:molybdopterin/thiamine biosynthesis adenylyltransferase